MEWLQILQKCIMENNFRENCTSFHASFVLLIPSGNK